MSKHRSNRLKKYSSAASLGPRQRAVLEHKLRTLAKKHDDLTPRWAKICELEHIELEKQKQAVLEELLSPLPPVPCLEGCLVTDAQALRSQHKLLLERKLLLESVGNKYTVDQETQNKQLDVRLQYLQSCLEDITSLQIFSARLPYIRSYDQYCEWLRELDPVTYVPAKQIAALLNCLPSEDRLRDLMLDPEQRLPKRILQVAERSIIQGESSFIPRYPANHVQVALMEDLFTSPSLRQKLLEITLSDGRVFYTEKPPTVDEESVRFSLSPLDPSYVGGDDHNIVWYDTAGVWKRELDPTGLMVAADINRESFFRDKNLPMVLTQVLQYEGVQCPALAQAYIYQRILQVMQVHDYPVIMGIRFAPKLRSDARSFTQLIHELGVELTPGCWLRNDKSLRRAEAAISRWFKQHRHHNYAKEMANNLQNLLQIRPYFCGYVAENGAPIFCRNVPKETLLWYFGQDGITTSPNGDPLEHAAIFSPIFITERSPL